MIGVVGDITAADLGPLLDRTFGDLPAAVSAAAIAEAGQLAAGADRRPRLAAERDPVRAARHQAQGSRFLCAAYVMNHILGGGGFARA